MNHSVVKIPVRLRIVAYNSKDSACDLRRNFRELLIQLGQQDNDPTIRLNLREKSASCRYRPGSEFS